MRRGQNGSREQGRIDSASLAHGEGSHRDSGGHLHHGEQGVEPLELRLHRHSQDRQYGLRRHDPSQMCGTAGRANEDFRSAVFCCCHVVS